MSQIPDLNLPYESDPEEDMDIEDVNSFIDSMYGGPAVWEEPTGLAYWGYSQSQVSDVLVDLAVSDASGNGGKHLEHAYHLLYLFVLSTNYFSLLLYTSERLQKIMEYVNEVHILCGIL
ncbi:hypothetical protein POM88_048850 [Heracleum sosnowskyi]|uniref:Uncharacterized protein n=1 Tax=Heracleum sosnowskyi TaxID=360622 RepID=A0AAD8M0V5_9APIA|nr:hypothetical protein POM88_048850 [Heracleum sosnowskyi]